MPALGGNHPGTETETETGTGVGVGRRFPHERVVASRQMIGG